MSTPPSTETTTMTGTKLTDLMRQRTKKPHDRSDRVVNLRLALVITSRELWAEALSLFAPIYIEMESILERNKTKEPYKSLYPLLSGLKRSSKFEQDIAFFLTNEQDRQELWKRRKDSDGKYHPEVLDRYIQRMRELEKANSPAIICYFYHMNMAMMAGGAFVKKAVMRAFKLKTDDGIQIFTYEVDSVKVIREELKSLINNIKLDEKETEIVLQESVRVFEQNNALVDTVQDSPWYSVAARDCLVYIAKWGAIVGVVIAGVVIASRYGPSLQPSE